MPQSHALVFEAVELGHRLSEKDYHAALPKLRARLLQAQVELRSHSFPVIVIVGGGDAAGKGELAHKFNDWLEPRGVETHAFGEPTDEEYQRPTYWRYWRIMPARGRIGILLGSWYADPLADRVYGDMKRSKFDAALDRITAFEQMLVDDGALLVKLWLHLPKTEQKERLKRLEKEGRLAPDEWKHFRAFDDFIENAERALRRTDTASAPWQIIEATDQRYRDLTAGERLASALERRLATAGRQKKKRSLAKARRVTPQLKSADSVLAHVDLTQKLTKAEYSKQLEHLQGKLSQLAWAAHRKKRSTVMVYEGWDAAGKGSAIRRVTQAMDPRLYGVVGTAAPTDEERAHHYLWRFWRQLPRAGFMTLFDRSWYGRVLVERIEGFAQPPEWMRAYHEINEFEEQLAEHGIILLKFWLHISPEEQLKRFKEREKVPYKRHKITEEDWRNRKKWADYQQAVDDMVMKCSTEFAPWTIVAGNDKRYARIQILRTIVERLTSALE